jgi:deoxycytidylate deaminase
MHYLEGEEKEEAEKFCDYAAKIALNSKCQKSKHGAVIVKDKMIIGQGWNTPVPDQECEPCFRKDLRYIKLELCNAIHAEHNAILDALSKGHDLKGSRMFHGRLKQGKLVKENSPSCTTCSRLMLHMGVAEMVLIQEQGYAIYPVEEFNRLSYDFCRNC